MRRTLAFLAVCALWPWQGALAIDVAPSKDTVPRKFFDPGGGKGLNLFSGDPKRVDRANAVARADFELAMMFEPEPLAIPAGGNESLPQIRAGLVAKNISKRPKTLTFTNSQRVDVIARSSDGRDLYRWSADKRFVESLGTSIVMPGEKVTFMVDVPLSAWEGRPSPGQSVAFSAVLANYPEFTATTNVVFVEGSGVPPPSVVSAPAPSAAPMPGFQAGSPGGPSPLIPEMGGLGLSSGAGLAPTGDAMPGFSLGSGEAPAAPGVAPVQDPLPLPGR
ncbi:MAG: hypothetical protein IT577_15345 [Verrucomicrobiae bacterium]|nr:hypothetical protein [Verrucomicrobiae bacterium]